MKYCLNRFDFFAFFIKQTSSRGRDLRFIAVIIFSLADVNLPSGKPKLCLNMLLMNNESEQLMISPFPQEFYSNRKCEIMATSIPRALEERIRTLFAIAGSLA